MNNIFGNGIFPPKIIKISDKLIDKISQPLPNILSYNHDKNSLENHKFYTRQLSKKLYGVSLKEQVKII